MGCFPAPKRLERMYPETPAYIFSGHVDTPTEFVWRFQGKDKNLAENEFFENTPLNKLAEWKGKEDLILNAKIYIADHLKELALNI